MPIFQKSGTGLILLTSGGIAAGSGCCCGGGGGDGYCETVCSETPADTISAYVSYPADTVSGDLCPPHDVPCNVARNQTYVLTRQTDPITGPDGTCGEWWSYDSGGVPYCTDIFGFDITVKVVIYIWLLRQLDGTKKMSGSCSISWSVYPNDYGFEVTLASDSLGTDLLPCASLSEITLTETSRSDASCDTVPMTIVVNP